MRKIGRELVRGLRLSDSRKQQAYEQSMCGAVCLAWKDCGDKEYTHACIYPAGHSGNHKFPCEKTVDKAEAK